MSRVVGEHPGGPEIWGYQKSVGPILDIFVQPDVTGTTERQERLFGIYLHRPGGLPPETWQKTAGIPEDVAGFVGLLRIIRGTTGRSHASLEAQIGRRHVTATIPPSILFDIHDIGESKRAIAHVFESPQARLFAGAFVVGATAAAAYKKLLAARRENAD